MLFLSIVVAVVCSTALIEANPPDEDIIVAPGIVELGKFLKKQSGLDVDPKLITAEFGVPTGAELPIQLVVAVGIKSGADKKEVTCSANLKHDLINLDSPYTVNKVDCPDEPKLNYNRESY